MRDIILPWLCPHNPLREKHKKLIVILTDQCFLMSLYMSMNFVNIAIKAGFKSESEMFIFLHCGRLF